MSSTQKDRFIHYQQKHHVGSIIMDHPPANAYQLDFMEELQSTLTVAENDPEARVIMLTSNLEKFFCTGADIKVFGTNSTSVNKLMVNQAREVAATITASEKIYLAVINGHALGGGLELAMACDLRFATDTNLLLGLPEVKLGLMPGNGGTQRLARLIGPGKALELCITGNTVTTTEAYRLGLINRLFPAEDLSSKSEEYARLLATGPPLAIAAIKQAIYQGSELTLEEALALEKSLVNNLYDTDDAKEGYTAFIEKRTPGFTGT